MAGRRVIGACLHEKSHLVAEVAFAFGRWLASVAARCQAPLRQDQLSNQFSTPSNPETFSA